MKNLLLFFILLFRFLAGAQIADSIPHSTITIFSSETRDFNFCGGNLYFLTKGDSLVIYRMNDRIVQKVIKNVQAFTVDRTGNLLYAVSGKIYKHFGKEIKQIENANHAVFNLLTDSRGYPIAKTAVGIYYKGKNYSFPEDILKRANFLYMKADVCYIDKEDRFWIAYDRGEWGGELIVFDTKEKTFTEAESLYSLYFRKYYKVDENKVDKSTSADHHKEFSHLIKITESDTLYRFPYEIDSNHVKGIAQDTEGRFLISHSIMHFFVRGHFTMSTPGIDRSLYKHTYFEDILQKEIVDGHSSVNEYLGPVAFNQFNHHFYYYTNNGFFKIIENHDGSFTKQFIVRPWATWTAGMEHSVGYQMNVSKFQFINEKEFLFLTTNNGIGHYTGDKVIYYK